MVHGLDIERAYCREISGAEREPHISAKQGFVAAVAFLPQTRLRGGLEPPIEIFVERDLGILYLAADVMLAQYLIKVGLRMLDWTADDLAVGSAVCGSRDRDRGKRARAIGAVPALRFARFFWPNTTPFWKNLAHHWHTGANNDCFNSTTWGEGGVMRNQSAPRQRASNN